MKNEHLKLLKDIREHFDQIGDGADDASYAARQALNFTEPLDHLINCVESGDSGAGYFFQRAQEEIYQNKELSIANALISIAISLQQISGKV